MKTFRARAFRTTFHYHEDLSGEITVQVNGEEAAGANTVRWEDATGHHYAVSTIGVPAEDFMEFAAHVAGLPFFPEHDDYDRETTELMVAHVEKCADCRLDRRCAKYFELILMRIRDKERRTIQ
jgi:hypothetical protein